MKPKRNASPTKTGAAASHQRRGNAPRERHHDTSAKQMNRNSAPSSNQFAKSVSR